MRTKKRKPKKKKGFTLIELLAVIIILGIIALIAVPQISNAIETAHKGSAETSAKHFLRAVEQKIPLSKLTNKDEIKNTTYSVQELYEKNLDIRGLEADGGFVEIDNGTVERSIVFIDGYTVIYENNEYTTEKGYFLKTGTPIYLNPETGKFCKSSEAISETGVKTGCMKWYVFNDSDDRDTIDMILDHNTTGATYWKQDTNYSTGLSNILEALKTDTDGWTGIPVRTDTYSYTNDSGLSYTLSYTDKRARLITANEVAQIVGLTSWDEKSATLEFNGNTVSGGDWYYLETQGKTKTSTQQGQNEYAWLFDYTSNCYSAGCNIKTESREIYGYWTASAINGRQNNVWRITSAGRVYDDNAVPSNTYVQGRGGVRPVITLSKDLFFN